MSVTLTIGQESRPLEQATSHWITQTVHAYQQGEGKVCVILNINLPDLSLGLATKTCDRCGGHSREELSPEQQEIVDLWIQLGLAEQTFSPGQVNAFVRQIGRMLEVNI